MSSSHVRELALLEQQLENLKNKPVTDVTRHEALTYAKKCAELQLVFIKAALDKSERSEMKQRFDSILDAAEEIQSNQSWTPDANTLFDLNSLRPLVSLTPSIPGTRPPTSKVQPPPSAPSPHQNAKKLKSPVPERKPPNKEKLILWKGSKLHGIYFPPWESDPDPGEFVLNEDGELFVDECEFRLSEDQKEMIDGWKRPKDAFPPPSLMKPGTVSEATMAIQQKADLVQDAATDCSVVASLCAAIARGQMGHEKILGNILHPYDYENDCPAVSENGKYYFRLNFNGCYRRVVIDDRLPVSKTHRILHVTDRANPGLYWPALLEKAYLKVYGGYEFPGSNSGTDLWIITGWIPEHIILDHPDTDIRELWSRIYSNFARGHVLVTMGTGNMSEAAERDFGLAGEHDYAILDMKEVDGQRWLFVKNPWLKSASYKTNRPAVDDNSGKVNGSSHVNTEYQTANIHTQENGDVDIITSGVDLIDLDTEKSQGKFWITLEDVQQHFQSIYLNWYPGLFNYRQDFHFEWDLLPSESKRSAPGSFSKNPQYAISTEEGGTAWFLISRHYTDCHLAAAAAKKELGYMTLYAFKAKGKRVHLSKGAVEQGQFVDSPQTLLRLTLDPNEQYTIVLSEQDLPPTLHSYTLTAFSEAHLTMGVAPARFPYSTSVRGSWTKATAGGSANSPTYYHNPQFSFQLTKPSAVVILLETLDPKLSVHVKVAYGGGERVFTLQTRNIIGDSGEYRHGCAVVQPPSRLEPGTYTVICSTFETGQCGEFTLLLDSDIPAKLQTIHKEGAGRLRTRLSQAIMGPNVQTMSARMQINAMCRINLVAQHVIPNDQLLVLNPTYSPIRISVENGTGPYRNILITSGNGEFSDAASGVRTEDVDLAPPDTSYRETWLILERMGGISTEGKAEERIQVDVLADTADAVIIGPWRVFER